MCYFRICSERSQLSKFELPSCLDESYRDPQAKEQKAFERALDALNIPLLDLTFCSSDPELIIQATSPQVTLSKADNANEPPEGLSRRFLWRFIAQFSLNLYISLVYCYKQFSLTDLFFVYKFHLYFFFQAKKR